MKENLIRQLQNQGLTITTTSTGWLFDVQPGPTETSELPELMVTEDQCNIIQRLGTIVGIQYYYSTEEEQVQTTDVKNYGPSRAADTSNLSSFGFCLINN